MQQIYTWQMYVQKENFIVKKHLIELIEIQLSKKLNSTKTKFLKQEI